MSGVNVVNMPIDVLFFLNEQLEGWKKYLNNEKAAIYLDPPYLAQKKNENSAEETEQNKKRKTYSPGSIYEHNFSEEQHIMFLKLIRQSKAKIIISNYDDNKHIYARYLEDGEGLTAEEKKTYKPFRRIEIETTTTLNDKSEFRTECLWLNF